jgi:uncharacterized protein YegL
MPGSGNARRPLHFIIVADCSGGMTGEKMQALNFAVTDLLSHLTDWERLQLRARLLVRVLGFSTDCEWQVGAPVPVAELRWRPLEAVREGWSNMGQAFSEVARAIGPGQLEVRALNPAVLLVSDGRATDSPENFEAGLNALLSLPARRSALRLAMAIGRDADYESLDRFIADPEVPVVVADNTEAVTGHLFAASFAGSHASAPEAPAHRILLENLDKHSEGENRETIV